jgi:hypothetical protein
VTLRTCVAPSGEFVFGIHKPQYKVENLREKDYVGSLGEAPDGRIVENGVNFPPGPVAVPDAEWVYEVPNPLPFRGTTYILKKWADGKAKDPSSIGLPAPPTVSLSRTISKWFPDGENSPEKCRQIFKTLPQPLQLSLAKTTTDPGDLMALAAMCCEFVYDSASKRPVGLRYRVDSTGQARPVIHDYLLFEMLANNYHLPDDYKEVMVLRPGVQGGSEIVGEPQARTPAAMFSSIFGETATSRGDIMRPI